MRLIIGGAYQGKLSYAQKTYSISSSDITDGALCQVDSPFRFLLLNNFHVLVRRRLEGGQSVDAFVSSLVSDNPNGIIISDEIGCGVVPNNELDRAWREAVGRALCHIAENAGSVERVVCSISNDIKNIGSD